MTKADAPAVLEMMRVFYASPAVLSNGSEEIFQADVENCVNDCPFLEGYIFEEAGMIQGYGMVAKSFSTEFGKPCIWILCRSSGKNPFPSEIRQFLRCASFG